MRIPRYYTVGAIVPNGRSLKVLGDRLDTLDLASDYIVGLTRRRDKRLAQAVLTEAHVESLESGLSRRQWLEFASTFFSASTVCFLMGVVHLWTGLVVQVLLTVAAVAGLIVHHSRSHLQQRVLRLGMPEHFAGEWETT